MTHKDLQLVVTEDVARCMRVWEELGGPTYLSLEDTRTICIHEMTMTEFMEVPTWPKKDDVRQGFHYQLPRRLVRKPRSTGF